MDSPEGIPRRAALLSGVPWKGTQQQGQSGTLCTHDTPRRSCSGHTVPQWSRSRKNPSLCFVPSRSFLSLDTPASSFPDGEGWWGGVVNHKVRSVNAALWSAAQRKRSLWSGGVQRRWEGAASQATVLAQPEHCCAAGPRARGWRGGGGGHHVSQRSCLNLCCEAPPELVHCAQAFLNTDRHLVTCHTSTVSHNSWPPLETLTGNIAGNFQPKRKKPKMFSGKYGDLGPSVSICPCSRLSKRRLLQGLIVRKRAQVRNNQDTQTWDWKRLDTWTSNRLLCSLWGRLG